MPRAASESPSSGGYNCELHLAFVTQGRLIALSLGPDEEHDMTRIEEPLAEHKSKTVNADKAYDANHLLNAIHQVARWR